MLVVAGGPLGGPHFHARNVVVARSLFGWILLRPKIGAQGAVNTALTHVARRPVRFPSKPMAFLSFLWIIEWQAAQSRELQIVFLGSKGFGKCLPTLAST